MAIRPRAEKRETWQRFTLLDMLLVQAGFGLGFSLAFSLGPGEMRTVERVIAGVVFGSVLAGPIVLLTQWTLRRRSRPLSAGEWLWLSPPVLFFALWCSVRISAVWHPGIGGFLFVVWMFVEVTCLGVAVALLVSGLRGYRSTVPCYWTDRSGCWVALLFGMWVFVFVFPAILLG
jgi:hypothetical protein